MALGLGGAAFALRLRPTAAASTFVSSSSPEYRATQRFYANFGEEPIEVLVKGDLQQLVLSSDVDRLVGLEGCLSGNVPVTALAKEGGASGPCGQLAQARTVKVVFDDFASETGRPILAGEKQVGTMGSAAGPNGLALVRIDRVTEALDAGVTLTSGGMGLRVTDPASIRAEPKQTVA